MSCKADLTVKPEVTPFFDPATNTISYVVKDPGSDACAVVDSVMDIDYAAGRISYESADAIIAFVRDRGGGFGDNFDHGGGFFCMGHAGQCAAEHERRECERFN